MKTIIVNSKTNSVRVKNFSTDGFERSMTKNDEKSEMMQQLKALSNTAALCRERAVKAQMTADKAQKVFEKLQQEYVAKFGRG